MKQFLKSQAGIGFGYIIAIIAMIIGLGAAAMKYMSDSSPNSNEKLVQLDAGTIGKQLGDIRDSRDLLSFSTSSTWTAFGNYSAGDGTYLALTDGSTKLDLDKTRQMRPGPIGAAVADTGGVAAPVEYRIGTPLADGTAFVWTNAANVPNAVCAKYNKAVLGEDAARVSAALSAASGSITSGAADSGGGVLTYAMLSGFEAAATTLVQTSGCYAASANGPGRIIARL